MELKKIIYQFDFTVEERKYEFKMDAASPEEALAKIKSDLQKLLAQIIVNEK